jgi:hypothetical protein
MHVGAGRAQRATHRTLACSAPRARHAAAAATGVHSTVALLLRCTGVLRAARTSHKRCAL